MELPATTVGHSASSLDANNARFFVFIRDLVVFEDREDRKHVAKACRTELLSELKRY